MLFEVEMGILQWVDGLITGKQAVLTDEIMIVRTVLI